MLNTKLIATCCLVSGGIAPLCATQASADGAAYAQQRIVEASAGGLHCVHQHDWSGAKYESRERMWFHNGDIFGEENDFASLECSDEKTKHLVFRRPVPAFTYLSITQDGAYIVGLSKIKLRNPFQIAIFDREGHVLYRSHVAAIEACFSTNDYRQFKATFKNALVFLQERVTVSANVTYVDFSGVGPGKLGDKAWNTLMKHECESHLSPNIRESVSNFVIWYNTDDPGVELVRNSEGKPMLLRLLDPEKEQITIALPRAPSGGGSDAGVWSVDAPAGARSAGPYVRNAAARPSDAQ